MIHDSEIYVAYCMRLDNLVKAIGLERAPSEETLFWLPPMLLVEKHPEPEGNFSSPQPIAAPALAYYDEDGEDGDDEEEPKSDIPELPPADNVIVYGGFHSLAEYALEYHASGVAANGAYSLNTWDVNRLEFKRIPDMREIYAMIQVVKEIREEAQTVVMNSE